MNLPQAVVKRRPHRNGRSDGCRAGTFLAVGVLVGGGLFLVACTNNPPVPQTAELRFIDNSQNVALVVGAVGARAVNAANLGPIPTLPLLGNPSLNSVDLAGKNVSLNSVDNQGLPGPQMETHLFVVDLTDQTAYFRGVGAGQPIQQWDDRAHIGARGLDVVLPFPPNANWDPTQRYRVGFLFPVVFWPGVPPADPADFPNPPGFGSIKSVRFHHPGLCGVEVSFTNSSQPGQINGKIYDTISDSLFQKFASNDQLDRGSAQRTWSRVTTLLDDGLDIFGPKGGFFLYFWFTATAGHGLQNVNFTANYEYQFTLSDGRLAVIPTKNDLLVQPQSAYGGFKDALENQLPQTLNANFVQQQKKSFFNCGDNNDPSNSVGLVAGFAQAGGQKLGFSDADQQRLQNAIRQPQNWSCDDDGTGTIKANFNLRAKRINVYPDAIELVWFDEINPDDAMYALYAASVANGSATSLCMRPRTTVDGVQNQYIKRDIVTVSR